jgi:hypothetical protein
MKVETAGYFETLIPTYLTTRWMKVETAGYFETLITYPLSKTHDLLKWRQKFRSSIAIHLPKFTAS